MSEITEKSDQQKVAEAEVESFRKELGPFVVAAETTRMAMVFTDATKPDDPIIFANDSFPRSASMSSIIIRTSITSLGYGDVVINGRARLIAPLQAVNGLMMFGITTGLFIAAFQHAVKKWIETHRDSARH